MRAKINKFVTLFLAACLCCCALGGCGAKDKNDKKENTDLNYEEIYKSEAAKYEDNTHPVAVIVMESGKTIAFELYEDIAPNTVNNFISLANAGFYDGVIFHRVIGDFMIQTGDPQGTGFGGPGYMIKGEFGNNGHKNDLSHQPGVVSMARQGNQYNPPAAYNTAGSQFFICVADDNFLDNDYAAFGKVISGMDVAYEIAKVKTDSNDKPLTTQKMAYVRVDTHGVTYAEPETIAE